jgi:hypothetical protein
VYRGLETFSPEAAAGLGAMSGADARGSAAPISEEGRVLINACPTVRRIATSMPVA